MSLNRQKLTRTVEDVCLFGIATDISVSKAAKVVNIILNAIKKGLERDGRVTIQGLGTFVVKTRKPCIRPCVINNPVNNKIAGHYLKRVPERKVVKFIPCAKLNKSLRD